MGKFDALLKVMGLAAKDVGDDAVKLLSHIDSPEMAVALKGDARKAYLNALDEVHGPAEQRAKDMGFNQDVYHGTPYKGKIDAFRESGTKRGDIAKYGKGVYVTPSKGYANQYAAHGEGQIIPLKAKDIKDFNPADLEQAQDILKEMGIDSSLPSGKGRLRYTMEGQDLLEKKLGKEWSVKLAEKGYRPNLPEDLITVRGANELRSPGAAFDPRFKDSPLLMAGIAGGVQLPQTDMSPLPMIKRGIGTYNEAKDKVMEPLANQLNISNNPDDKNTFQSILGSVFDPVNAISGPVGLGLGAAQMMGDDKEETAKQSALKRLTEGY